MQRFVNLGLFGDIGQQRGGATPHLFDVGGDSVYFSLCPAIDENMEAARSSAMA